MLVGVSLDIRYPKESPSLAGGEPQVTLRNSDLTVRLYIFIPSLSSFPKVITQFYPNSWDSRDTLLTAWKLSIDRL